MRKYFSMLFLVSCFSTNAQSYIDYNFLKDKGQECIIDKKFQEAQIYYDSIYNNYDFIYAGDCFVGLKLAVQNNDSIRANKFLLKGISMGVPIKLVKNDEFLNKNLKFDLWHGISQEKIDSLLLIYNNRINKELVRQISIMYVADQKATFKVNKSFLYYFKWRIVSKRNAKIIKEIIQTYGYPGEKLLGVQLSTNKNGDTVCNPYYPNRSSEYFMLIHYFSDKVSDWEEYQQLLYNQLENGNLRPSQYADFCDFKARWKKSKRQGTDYFYNEWHYDPDTTRIPEINKRRAEIGLLDFDFVKKKLANQMDTYRNKSFDTKIF